MTGRGDRADQVLVALQTLDAHAERHTKLLEEIAASATHANALQVHSIVVPPLRACRRAEDVPHVWHDHKHLIGPLPEPDRNALWTRAARRIVALDGAADVSAAKKYLKATLTQLNAAEKGARP